MRTIQRRLNLFALLLLLAAGASGCARHGIITVETSNSESRGVLIGDTRPVRDGALETIRLADVSNGVIDWGIGYGRIGGEDAPMTDTVFLGGAPLQATGLAAEGQRFVGPFAVGLAPDQRPAARYRSAPSMKSASVADLLSDLASTFEKPVLVVGLVEFDRLSSGDGLDGNAPTQSFRNRQALFIGIVARHEDVLNQASRRVFDIPEGMEGLVDDLMLSSAVVIKDPPRNWRTAGAQLGEHAETLVPVDPTTSFISGGEIDVYLINSLTQP